MTIKINNEKFNKLNINIEELTETEMILYRLSGEITCPLCNKRVESIEIGNMFAISHLNCKCKEIFLFDKTKDGKCKLIWTNIKRDEN